MEQASWKAKAGSVRNMIADFRLDMTARRRYSVASCCVNGNEPLGPMKGWEITTNWATVSFSEGPCYTYLVVDLWWTGRTGLCLSIIKPVGRISNYLSPEYRHNGRFCKPLPLSKCVLKFWLFGLEDKKEGFGINCCFLLQRPCRWIYQTAGSNIAVDSPP
jgi:hypothetical protein